MKRAAAALVGAGLALAAQFEAGASFVKERPAAKWARMLGAEDSRDREEASARLLAMGLAARSEVRRALDSPDPEVKWRARELWKTLRWMVVPNAEKETMALVEAARAGKDDEQLWRDFSKQHGAATLALVMEFRRARQPAKVYDRGARAVIEECKPIEIARAISEANAEMRSALLDTLREGAAKNPTSKIAASVVSVDVALWNYRAAFDYGRESWLKWRNDDLLAQCATAVDRGKFADEMWCSATCLDDRDPATLFQNAAFYVGLARRLNSPEPLRPLIVEQLRGAGISKKDTSAVQTIVRDLLEMKLVNEAGAVLATAADARCLYLRSVVHDRKGEKSAAEEDWNAALKAIDATPDKDREAELYSLGELMQERRDPRAESIWLKILDTDPEDSIYDANACFRLGNLYDTRKENHRAADFFERGLEITKKTKGAILISQKPGEKRPGEEVIREIIDRLRGHAHAKPK
jgi:tetratricopeptide (TPR) repeat protein